MQFQCFQCKGSGHKRMGLQNFPRCKECNGAGGTLRRCDACSGTAKVRCAKCRGTGKAGLILRSGCPKCFGKGTVACTKCGTHGLMPIIPSGSIIETPCKICGASGIERCEVCLGAGTKEFEEAIKKLSVVSNNFKPSDDDNNWEGAATCFTELSFEELRTAIKGEGYFSPQAYVDVSGREVTLLRSADARTSISVHRVGESSYVVTRYALGTSDAGQQYKQLSPS